MSSTPSRSTNDGASTASTSKPWANQSVLGKPLYVYQLPSELLQNLQLRSIDVEESEQAQTQQGSGEIEAGTVPIENRKVVAQKVCPVCPHPPPWEGPGQARSHLRSDWHRYNAALGKTGRQDERLDEEAFQQRIEELSSQESSSEESEAEEEGRGPVDHVAALLSKLPLSSAPNAESDSDEDLSATRAALTAKEPYLWFVTQPSTALHIQQTQFGVLRGLFPEADSDVVRKDWYISALSAMQSGPLQANQVPRDVKRFKGGSAAVEAANMLSAVFMDASGEAWEEEESSDEESAAEGSSDEAQTEASTATIATTPTPPSPLRTWTILLLAGGNFSAVTLALNPREQLVSKRKGTSERQYLILARNQIHRYTTRRKQGGAQSTQDSSGKFAKSAGAQLRRYGEQALADDIRALLHTKVWRDCISSSEKVWVRAGLRSARGVLWNWAGTDESPLEAMRKTARVQTLPIATRKPTVGECLRCFADLTRVRVRHDTEEELQARDEAYRAQLESSARAKQERRQREKERARREADAREATLAAKRRAAGAKLDDREVQRRERLSRLIEMIRKGRMENTVNHLERYERELLKPAGWDSEAQTAEPDDVDEAVDDARNRINTILPFWWRYQDAKEKGALLLAGGQDELTGARQQLVPATLLQVAAEGGHASQVSYFLTERRSDPTIAVRPPPVVDATGDDADTVGRFPHRTAYDMCTSREARDVFRRLMAAQPDWAHWSGTEAGGARVTKALTAEMEEARHKEEVVRDKRQAMKEKARLRQDEEDRKQTHDIDLAAIQQANSTPVAAPKPSSASKNRLGGSNTAPRALHKERDEAAGLSPEVRARIEREKRARAAEARFKGLKPS